MSPHPKIRLSELRQIGWDHWDPIGIRCSGGGAWKEAAADEYDAYLLHVVSLLHRGVAPEKAISYLDEIASDNMGLGASTPEGHQASAATVAAISAYLKTLPDGPPSLR